MTLRVHRGSLGVPLLPVSGPNIAVLEFLAGRRVLAAEKRPPDSAGDAVTGAEGPFCDDLTAGERRQGRPFPVVGRKSASPIAAEKSRLIGCLLYSLLVALAQHRATEKYPRAGRTPDQLA